MQSIILYFVLNISASLSGPKLFNLPHRKCLHSICETGLQPNVKQLRWESAPQAPDLVVCLKNTGLLTVGGESMPQAREFKYLQGSRVIGKWNMRWAGSLLWHQQVFRQRSYQLISVPSPTAISFGEWPKVWDHGYKRPKMSLLCSQLDSALEMGWRARTWAAAPLLHTEVSKGVWSWLLPFKSLLGGDPAVDAELTGGYVWSYIYWYWDTSGFHRESWKVRTGRGTFGILCFACSYCDQIPDKWRMDGWMRGFLAILEPVIFWCTECLAELCEAVSTKLDTWQKHNSFLCFLLSKTRYKKCPRPVLT